MLTNHGSMPACRLSAFPEAEIEPLGGHATDNGEHFDIYADTKAPLTAQQSAAVLRAAAGRGLLRGVTGGTNGIGRDALVGMLSP